MLYSSKQADRVVRDASIGPLTVANVTSVLAGEVSVTHCAVFGYISIEKDLVFLVVPTVSKPTNSQVSITKLINVFEVRCKNILSMCIQCTIQPLICERVPVQDSLKCFFKTKYCKSYMIESLIEHL